MSSLKKIFRQYDKLRDKRRSSREADAHTRENIVKLPTTDPERQNDAAQHEDGNPPSLIIDEPPAEQEAVYDSEPSNTAMVLTEIAKASVTPPESIWNEAYDSLKVEEPKLVQAYEKILSIRLNEDHESDKNIIQAQNASLRRAQMYQLIDNGLKKTAHEAIIKGSLGTVMQVVDATKKLIGDAIKDIPQAALPWAVVCVSLEVRPSAMI